MASGLNTEYQMTLSFYNEFGDYNVWAKQWDTERKLLFEFDEDGIIPSEITNFCAYLRGTFADGSLMPIIEVSEVTEDTLLFKLTSDFLAVPGRAKAELVLTDNSEVEEFIDIDAQGHLIIPDGVRILSTHSFYIKIEATAVIGGELTPHEQDIVDILIKLIETVNGNENIRQANEDERIANEEERQEHEIEREDKETGYIARARSWAIGPSDNEEYEGEEFPGTGTDELNARAQAYLAQGYAQQVIDKTESTFLKINNEDGHLYMYKAGQQTTMSFQISADHKNLEVIMS